MENPLARTSRYTIDELHKSLVDVKLWSIGEHGNVTLWSQLISLDAFHSDNDSAFSRL